MKTFVEIKVLLENKNTVSVHSIKKMFKLEEYHHVFPSSLWEIIYYIGYIKHILFNDFVGHFQISIYMDVNLNPIIRGFSTFFKDCYPFNKDTHSLYPALLTIFGVSQVWVEWGGAVTYSKPCIVHLYHWLYNQNACTGGHNKCGL